MNPELQSKVMNWRIKAAAGNLTVDEMKEAIIALRAGRVSAAETSAKSASKRAAAKKVVVSGDDLLGELGEL